MSVFGATAWSCTPAMQSRLGFLFVIARERTHNAVAMLQGAISLHIVATAEKE